MKIAAILTIHNRKTKTLTCLHHLFKALDAYNSHTEEPVDMSVFVTDDGSVDGTAEAIKETFGHNNIKILKGTGSLYWAGGMRLAWQSAIDSDTKWDYYLLMNDDTNVFTNVFDELFKADHYGYQQTGRHGLSSGITCKPDHPEVITYGGFNFVNRTKGRFVTVIPSGQPQHADLTHANILLVHHSVTERIGIFNKGFRHRAADWDYGLTAHRKGFPTNVTANVCGECDNDHDTGKEEIGKLRKMSLSERISFINSPLHNNHDTFLYVRRNLPFRYPMTVLARTTRLLFPSVYYHITNMRGVYKNS